MTGRRGLLARASAPIEEPWLDDGTWRESADGRRRWRGNVSSDQVAAFMFGIFVHATHLADAAGRNALGATVAEVVDAIVEDGLRIVGYDGQPTRWGHYEPSYVADQEPMNALLLLQMVKVAHALTGLARFDREYERLLSMGYARIGEAARLDRPPRVANHSDDVLIALALYPLLELEDDPDVRRHYERAERRWFHGGVHPGIDVEANPFATLLHRHWTGERDYDAAALETLRRAPLDMKWNAGTIAAYARRFGFSFDADPILPRGGDGPLPIAQRGRTWSFLVHNPYRTGGDRLAAGAVRDERPRLPDQLLVRPRARDDPGGPVTPRRAPAESGTVPGARAGRPRRRAGLVECRRGRSPLVLAAAPSGPRPPDHRQLRRNLLSRAAGRGCNQVIQRE